MVFCIYLDSGVLNIDVLEANDLMAADLGGTSDPYVRCKLNGQQFYKTKHIKKSLNPRFDETTTVDVVSRHTSILLFEVFDFNAIQKHVSLGSAFFNLAQVKPGVVQNEVLHLTNGKGTLKIRFLFDAQEIQPKNGIDMESRMNKEQQSGVSKFTRGLTSQISFAGKKKNSFTLPSLGSMNSGKKSQSKESLNDVVEEESEKFITHAPQVPVINAPQEESVPMIQVQLPTPERSHSEAQDVAPKPKPHPGRSISRNTVQDVDTKEELNGTVTLHILGASGLMAVDSNGFSDPYIKVYHGDGKSIFKTSVKKKTLVPEWVNEKATFNIPEYTVKLSVKDHNTFSEDKDLGSVTINLLVHFSNEKSDFDEWFDIQGGSGRLHLSGHLDIFGSLKPSESRVSVNSTSSRNSLFKRKGK